MKQSHDPPSLSLNTQKHLQGVASVFHSDPTDGLDTPVQAVSRRGPQGVEVRDCQLSGERLARSIQRTMVDPQLLCSTEGGTCRRTALYPQVFNRAVGDLRAQLYFLDGTECGALRGAFEAAEMYLRASCQPPPPQQWILHLLGLQRLVPGGPSRQTHPHQPAC